MPLTKPDESILDLTQTDADVATVQSNLDTVETNSQNADTAIYTDRKSVV